MIAEDSRHGCEYKVALDFCLGGQLIHDEGLMTADDGRISLRLNSPKSENFVLFDFSYDSAEMYYASIELDSSINGVRDYQIAVTVDNKYNRDNKIIYAFRVTDFYCYTEYSYDLVYFVTEESGVIGSYVSDFDAANGREYYMYPSGDFLPDLIDYTKKTETVLK